MNFETFRYIFELFGISSNFPVYLRNVSLYLRNLFVYFQTFRYIFKPFGISSNLSVYFKPVGRSSNLSAYLRNFSVDLQTFWYIFGPFSRPLKLSVYLKNYCERFLCLSSIFPCILMSRISRFEQLISKTCSHMTFNPPVNHVPANSDEHLIMRNSDEHILIIQIPTNIFLSCGIPTNIFLSCRKIVCSLPIQVQMANVSNVKVM